MKIKGSVEFYSKEIKKNLEYILQEEGHCRCLDCNKCIFSKKYAKDKKLCSDNSIFKHTGLGNLIFARIARAKEILEEIANNEN